MNSFTFFYIILPIVLALVLWLLLFFSYQKNKKLRGVSSGLGLALYLISAPENIKAQEGDEKFHYADGAIFERPGDFSKKRAGGEIMGQPFFRFGNRIA